jgi:hypothetical protein
MTDVAICDTGTIVEIIGDEVQVCTGIGGGGLAWRSLLRWWFMFEVLGLRAPQTIPSKAERFWIAAW